MVHAREGIPGPFDQIESFPQIWTKIALIRWTIYPDAVVCWNNLDPILRTLETLSKFKSEILKIIRPMRKEIFNIHNPVGIKYIYQLRVGLSTLKAHKKAHNFSDTPNDICICCTGSETTIHYLLKCPMFASQRDTLLSSVRPIILKVSPMDTLGSLDMVNILLYGNKGLTFAENSRIIRATIEFIVDSGRFLHLPT